MNQKDIHKKVLSALADRNVWETRQRVWYQMRHTGVRRIKPPWPNAADMHYPLIDGAVDKFKPFYSDQIFQGERIAEFMALNPELDAACSSAADYFHWELAENTNFADELECMNDFMLLTGKGVMKARWDIKTQKLTFEAINPLFLIVPKGCNTLQEADFVCHVKQMTKDTYERTDGYKHYLESGAKVSDFIQGGDPSTNQNAQENDKQIREGITYSQGENQVIVWEVFVKGNGGWTVYTYAPTKPEIALRKPWSCRYKVDGQVVAPFQSFAREIKDKGWYSSRGLAEKLAPFEQKLCKDWNTKADFMTFSTTPLMQADDAVPPNMANFKLGPGELLPKGVHPVTMPACPIELEQEMNFTRATAEQFIQVPDAGIAPEETKGRRGGTNAVTATQIQFQAQLSHTGINYLGRGYRRQVGWFFRLCWVILVDHKKGDIAYFSGNDRKVIPAQALSEDFRIVPSGSPDAWNKQLRMQRAVTRFQLFKGDPAINQDELKKDVLLSDDPRLIQRMFIGDQLAQQQAQYEQAVKILVMEEGMPVPVSPNDNHIVAIQVDLAWLQKQGMTGAPVDPRAQQLVHADIAAHYQILQKQNAPAAKQLAHQISQSEQAPMQPPSNVAQMPPQPQNAAL